MATVISGNDFNSCFPPLGMSNSSDSKLGFPTYGIPNLLKCALAAPISVIPSVVAGSIPIHEGDSPIVQQIKGLTKELSVLRNDLIAKQKLIESLTAKDQVPVTGQGVGASWKDKVSPPSVSHSRMKLQFFPLAVERETIRVSPPQHAEIYGAEWNPDLVFEKEGLSKLTLWIQLYNVPLQYWSEEGLSYIASAVGKPLYADEMTESARRISYAKICVEVDVHSPLPHSIDLLTSTGNTQTLPQTKVWVVKSGKAVEDLNYNPKTSRIQKSPMAADVNLPCSNQFSALQRGEVLSNDQAVIEQRAITALNGGLTGCAAALLGNSEPSIDVGLEHLVDDNHKLDEAGISTLVPPVLEVPTVSDFLPHDLDPDVVFEALTVMEASNSKKTKGGQNLGAVESKVRKENMSTSMLCCLPSRWEFIHNGDVGPVARIIVAWRKQGSVIREIFKSDQVILIFVEIDMTTFLFSVIYGFNQATSRRQLWVDLRSCHGIVGSQPWILVGDFNSVRWQNEKSNPSHFDASAAAEFNSCLNDVEVEDLNAKGLWFSWSNRRVGLDHSSSRIDRALGNSHWQSKLTEFEAAFLAPGVFSSPSFLGAANGRSGLPNADSVQEVRKTQTLLESLQ
ncbi:hypothetical protein RHSIM_Rhsim10G0146400 [Rhododendron simsii]|uniref:DUF4283 domain-containing protein n=1 Tax=Rhododendron simsii TaxID=118357 RepID=A0A834GAH8_RHOSS|nr:hypothetical protein RHSIM_Rhsim10G0146400 [Rhododendron simsii]